MLAVGILCHTSAGWSSSGMHRKACTMFELTNDNPIEFSTAVPTLYNPAILANFEFQRGFQEGIEVYEAECADANRLLTAEEVCSTVRHDLDPRIRANGVIIAQHLGASENLLFDSGFLAGWLYAHLLTPASVVERYTQPLAVVVPFGARAH